MLLASIYICTKRILYDASIGRHFKLNNMHLFGFCISLVNVSEDVQIKFFYRFNQRLELHFQRTVPIHITTKTINDDGGNDDDDE